MKYDITNHGVAHEQYFPGVGVGDYDDAYVGMGETPAEAYQDALDYMIESDPDACDHMRMIESDPDARDLDRMTEVPPEIAEIPENEEQALHCYVSIRVKWD